MSSSITGDGENGNDLFLIFLEVTTFLGHDLPKSRDAAPNGADFQEKAITYLAVTHNGSVFSILAENL